MIVLLYSQNGNDCAIAVRQSRRSLSSWMDGHVQSSWTDGHDQSRRSQSSLMGGHVQCQWSQRSQSSWMDGHVQGRRSQSLWVVAGQHGMDAVLTAGLAR